MAIAQWHECKGMARPGIVFEVKNAEGQTLLTECTAQVPPTPFGWKSPPVVFRAVHAIQAAAFDANACAQKQMSIAMTRDLLII